MFSNNYTAGNATTANAPTLAELQKIAAEFKKKDREILRGESLMIEEMECPTCHRKPTVRNGPFGKTYVVCEHTLAAIKAQCKPADPPAWTPGGFPPLGWSPYGVHIEVYDDGPRRW